MCADANQDRHIVFHIGAPKTSAGPGYVRCVCVGETFGNNIDVPGGDIYIHVGNFTTSTGNGVYLFTEYLQKLPHAYKIITGGTNEHSLAVSIMNNIQGPCLYIDGVTTLTKKLRVYSATRVTEGGVEFMPFTCYNDIIISHVPPAGILDENEFGEHIGSLEFLRNLKDYPPRVCVFSGNSAGGGAMYYAGILCINAGIYLLDRTEWPEKLVKYGVPLVFDIWVG